MPPRRRSPPRFIADAMLGSFARKLRIFGFDTAYFKEERDPELVRRVRLERRVLLTADRALAAQVRRSNRRVILLQGETDRARMQSLILGFLEVGLALDRGAPRCSTCNGRLRTLDRRHAGGLVPTATLARHRYFYRCSTCGKVYWRGAHWDRLRRLERLFEGGAKGTGS
jgi:uncharacterized protein